MPHNVHIIASDDFELLTCLLPAPAGGWYAMALVPGPGVLYRWRARREHIAPYRQRPFELLIVDEATMLIDAATFGAPTIIGRCRALTEVRSLIVTRWEEVRLRPQSTKGNHHGKTKPLT